MRRILDAAQADLIKSEGETVRKANTGVRRHGGIKGQQRRKEAMYWV